ncbi:hypothetical protein EV421DRAFT_1797299 [Armillaria borealis]|uniref:Uncharacterized protein n=1 Tax=Armillaria borealis TaxID=47425 RepID=A0AA39JNI2_9AGAR|nr:hypothetical protein EV421DRAFT_1797299 [Armillaria borealis]
MRHGGTFLNALFSFSSSKCSDVSIYASLIVMILASVSISLCSSPVLVAMFLLQDINHRCPRITVVARRARFVDFAIYLFFLVLSIYPPVQRIIFCCLYP